MSRVRTYTPEQRAKNSARQCAYAKIHREAIRERMKPYWSSEEYRIHRRLYRSKNRRHIISKISTWKKQNREATRVSNRAWERKAWNKLTDSQLRKYLKRKGTNKPTQQEIEICRQRIQIKRVARTMKLHNAAQQLLKALRP